MKNVDPVPFALVLDQYPETKLIPDIPTSKLLLMLALFCFELLKTRQQDGTEPEQNKEQRAFTERSDF
jgi:hypothetical protein